MELATVVEAAKLEELVQRFEADGYDVRLDEPVGDAVADLVAVKNGRRVAVDVVARPHLAEQQEARRALRRAAKVAGFSEYRMVIVSPPREPDLEVEGLEDVLYQLCQEKLLVEFDHRSSCTRMADVVLEQIDLLHVGGNRVQIAGTAHLGLHLQSGDRSDDDDRHSTEYIPIAFDLELDAAGEVREVHRLEPEADA